LKTFSRAHGLAPAQAALAWLLSKEGVIVIPKTGRRDRLRENLGALDRPLDAAQLAELDRLFPPPAGPQPLEML
jgi:aldehyde reductase